jgi:hypothetical protein
MILSFDVGIKNLAYCVLDSTTFHILAWNVCQIPTDIHQQLEYLDTCDFWNVSFDTVIIEKQPARNVKMRLVENTLSVYFFMKGVKFVSSYNSKHKLGSLGKHIKGVKNYNVRKKYGIAMTNSFIQDTHTHTQYAEFFNKHKKKDDLSDCLLQALTYAKYNVDQLHTSIVQL